jgi:hypothetical protein
MTRAVLLFGASGAIGSHLAERLAAGGDRVIGVSRGRAPKGAGSWISYDPLKQDGSALDAHAPYAAVCWAQGANLNDNVRDVDPAAHLELYRANVLYVIVTLKALLTRGLLTKPARLCVVSSIWQKLARQNKLSYGVTKAALQGLVLSASADLAADGHLINAVLPGALDTPMTRKNLGREQIERIAGATAFGRLPSLADLAGAVSFLLSPANTGVTGQFLAVDLGFSHVRIV